MQANLNGNVQAAARAAQRAEELQHGADAAAQRLGEALAAAAAQGEAERAAAALLQADQECEVERLRAEKERCGEEAEEAEAAAAEQRRALCAGPAGAALHQREAALQEEVSLLRANLEEHASLEGRCAAAQEAQRRARDAHALAAASLAAAGRAQARADADAHAAASCNAAAGIRRQLQKDVRQLVAEAPGAQRASEEAQRALRSARASQQAAATAHASAKTRATRCAEQLAAATLDSPPSPQSVAQQHGQLARLRAQEAQLRRELAAAAARLPAAPAPWLAPLHACFSFRDPAACEELATALEVAVGGQLGVMVAPTRDRVAQELQRGGGNGNGNGALAAGARVWPLDALLQGDDAREARHRRAAASFPAGRVVLPLDLVQSGEGCGAAVGRALGALVVAADARTADALLHAHGVPSVALDGTVVRKGSITGGWRPEGGARSRGGLVRAKLRADGVRARLAAGEAEARQLAAAVQAGELAAAQAEERQQAAASAAEEEESAAQALAATAAELEAAAAGGAAAAARVQRAQAALQAKRAMLEGVAGEEGDGALVHALQHDALRHAEAAQESRRQEGALRREAAAAAETALALSHRLDISAPRVPDWRSALESSQTALLEARARMAEHRSASAAAQQAADAAGRAVVERRRHLGDLQGALEEAEQAAAAAADEVQRAEEALAAACQRERELAREVPALALRARRGGGAPTAAPPGDLACASLAGALEAADALAAEYKDLQVRGGWSRPCAAGLQVLLLFTVSASPALVAPFPP
jgi:chromosome segregation ATPase